LKAMEPSLLLMTVTSSLVNKQLKPDAQSCDIDSKLYPNNSTKRTLARENFEFRSMLPVPSTFSF
jgi:hypothetical protein